MPLTLKDLNALVYPDATRDEREVVLEGLTFFTTPHTAAEGAGCPVPPGGSVGDVSYGPSPEDVICPPYHSQLSQTHRSEAREVIRRFRALSPADQQALIEFLKEL